MAVLILVHGSWHGRWTWDKVSPALTRAGHEVIALDMPGRGNNPAPLEEQTLGTYVDTVVRALDSQNKSVHLIAHSAGGPIISQAAEERPDQIISLIYLSAFMLLDGQRALDIADKDKGNEILAIAEFMGDNKAALRIPADKARHPFYLDCSDKDVDWATRQLVIESTNPMGTPVNLTPERYGRIPRHYIECLQDRAISIDSQRQMLAAQPVETIITMDTSHSPFLSRTEELVDNILTLLNAEGTSVD